MGQGVLVRFFALVIWGLFCFEHSALAQSSDGGQSAKVPSGAVLVMDLQAALNQSETGSRLFMEQRSSLAALNDEFNVLQTELIAEEQALRDTRTTTDPEEFKILAEAFDLKSTKARKLYTDRREALLRTFQQEMDQLALVFSNVAGQIMEERGASVVLLKNQTVVSSISVDITVDVLRRVDAQARQKDQ